MSAKHSDKATKEKVQELKDKVLNLLAENKIDVSKLEVRALTCYGGDVRVYLGVNERLSRRIAFRREGVAQTTGSITTYTGTIGKHIITERDYITFNEEDFTSDYSMSEYNIYSLKKYLNNGRD